MAEGGQQLKDENPDSGGLELLKKTEHTTASTIDIKELLKNVKVPEGVRWTTREQCQQTRAKNECYPTEHSPRGNALVITMTCNRKGWQHDVQALHRMFLYLDVKPQYHFDLTGERLVEELNKFACDKLNESVDCLFVVLMGHGGKICHGGPNLNKEYLVTFDGYAFFLRENFANIFSSEKNSYLVRKVKLFLVQMCRGVQDTPGVKPDKKIGSDGAHIAMDAVSPSSKKPAFSDYIIGFATQPDTKAFRDEEAGAWYIQEVCTAFLKNAADKQVEDILKEVNRNLEKRASSGLLQVGEYLSALKASLFLFPGIHEKVEKPREIRDAWRVVGLPDHGALVATDKRPGELLRMKSDRRMYEETQFPAKTYITAIILQRDTVLVLEEKRRISRCRLDALSHPTAKWHVDVGRLEDGDDISYNELVLLDNQKEGKLVTCTLGSEPKASKQVRVRGLRDPTCVAWHHSGRTAVMERDARRVLVYDDKWQLQATIGKQGSGDGQMEFPETCIFLSSGNLLVADSSNHRVSEFERTGEFVRHWLTGKDGISYPVSLSFVHPNLWLVYGVASDRKVTKFKIFN